VPVDQRADRAAHPSPPRTGMGNGAQASLHAEAAILYAIRVGHHREWQLRLVAAQMLLGRMKEDHLGYARGRDIGVAFRRFASILT
jgi:hypothetical protein